MPPQSIRSNSGQKFLSIGFWATVTASLLGVWKTIPLMCADCFQNLFNHQEPSKNVSRGTLFLLTFAPLPLLSMGKPLSLIILFTVLSSLFIPFLAFSLLYLNYRGPRLPSQIRNSTFQSAVQGLILILFSWIGLQELQKLILK